MVHHKAKTKASSRNFRPQPASPRPRLSPEDVQNLADKMREAFRWEANPKDFQLDAVKAQIEGVDMIVQAPTGAGKTAIAAGPHYWPGNERRFTIMVCPLLSLEEEMETSFQVEYGLRAIALNSKNGACSPLRIKDILDLQYQIILISPEMLQSRTFVDRVLRNTSFMRRIISFFIDEAHCIVHWGADFRKKYGTLGKIRAFLPRGTPVMAVTATLTARVRRAIHSSLHFAQSEAPSRFINKGNDRSNVSIVVRACEHPLNTYADLDFIIPSTIRHPTDVPKTYLYVDNIAVGAEIIDYLNTKIEFHTNALSSTARPLPRGIVRPFNATLSQQYRATAMARFRTGDIRILVCTDAAGMGCNIADIDRVVQWKLPGTFSHFIQRAGRAARGRDRTGIAVLLVEKTAYSIDLTSPSGQSRTSKDDSKNTGIGAPEKVKKKAKEGREYAQAHGVLRGSSKKMDITPTGVQPIIDAEAGDEALLAFVQSTSCRRKVWAEVFESDLRVPIVPCCDICDPSLLDHTRPASLPPETKVKNPKRGVPDLNAQDKLHLWRDSVYSRDHAYALYDETAILPDAFIVLLVSHGPLTPSAIAAFLQRKWIFWDRHGEELVRHIQSLKIAYNALPSKARTTTKRSAQEASLDCSEGPTKRSRSHTEQPNSAASPRTISASISHTVVSHPPYFLPPFAPAPSSYPSPSPVLPTYLPHAIRPHGHPVSMPRAHIPPPVLHHNPTTPCPNRAGRTQLLTPPPTMPHSVGPPILPRNDPMPPRIYANYSVPRNVSLTHQYVPPSLPPTQVQPTYYPPSQSGTFPATTFYPITQPLPSPSFLTTTTPLPHQYVHTVPPTRGASSNQSPTMPSIPHYYSHPPPGFQ